MAITIQVDGPAVIKVDTGGSHALESLGYTEDGANVTEQVFTSPIHSDDAGGAEAPPADEQYLGEMHIIRMLLTKWDEAVIAKIRAGLYGGTAGTVGTKGSLYFQDTLSWRLLIHTTSRPRNYIRVIFSEPKEINKGTKFSKYLIVARAYEGAAGVLYNNTTT